VQCGVFEAGEGVTAWRDEACRLSGARPVSAGWWVHNRLTTNICRPPTIGAKTISWWWRLYSNISSSSTALATAAAGGKTTTTCSWPDRTRAKTTSKRLWWPGRQGEKEDHCPPLTALRADKPRGIVALEKTPLQHFPSEITFTIL